MLWRQHVDQDYTLPKERCTTRTLTAVLTALCAAMLVGCSGAQKREASAPESFEPVAPAAPALPAASTNELLGMSVEGRPIHWQRLGTGPDVTLIIATIHGNESAGTPLLERLEKELVASPSLLEGRTVALVPVANPDGYANGSRFNAHGVDLNRDFPAENFKRASHRGDEPLSQPESRALASLIARLSPDRIISIHQPLSCVDYDGPARALASAIAAGGPLKVRRLGGRGGSLGSYAGQTLGIPIITLELPGGVERRDADALWLAYGPMLLAGVSHGRIAREGP